MDRQLLLWSDEVFDELTPNHSSGDVCFDDYSSYDYDRSSYDSASDTCENDGSTLPVGCELPKILTSGTIAEILGQPFHRVARILATRSDIKPLAKAGNLRVYKSSVLARIRHELNAIDAKRTPQEDRFK